MKTVTRHIDSLGIDVEFVVGGNAQENHDIIDDASPDDLWFHVSGHPSCHVISKVPADVVVDKNGILKIAKQGAVVCKELSGLKKQKDVTIDWTRIKYVTKLEKLGSVTITNQKQFVI